MSADVLDQRTLSALRDFGSEPGKLLEEMLHDFLDEAPSLVADIERAVAESAYVTAARAAHRLRGASGHVGALRLAAAAGEIEGAASTSARRATAVAASTARTELDLAIVAARALLSI